MICAVAVAVAVAAAAALPLILAARSDLAGACGRVCARGRE
jgi:hypothetical protein